MGTIFVHSILVVDSDKNFGIGVFMNKVKLLLVAFFLIYSLIKAEKISGNFLKTSVIVPCHPKHAKYLYELLKAYEKQTNLPDEVVISISEVSQVDPSIIESLRTGPWHFHLKLILSEHKQLAAKNRNIACKNATGEIFICQDADDLPHPQRIEIVKYFFGKLNQLDFLLHEFVYNNNDGIQKIKNIDDFNFLKYSYIHTYHEAWVVSYILFGQPALHRRVFEKIQWPDIPIDEDNSFDNKVITSFKNCIMVRCPLYIYRKELSVTPYWLYRVFAILDTAR